MLAASVVTLAWASPLQAQRRLVPVHIAPPLIAEAVNDLSFGLVLPGIPASIKTGDPYHSGQFEIEGPRDASVRVEFTLPRALVSERGAQLDIRFGPFDGYADFSHGHPSRGRVFDPHRPVIRELGPNGRLHLRLGGTVFPERGQAGGAYSATISMTVYNLGS